MNQMMMAKMMTNLVSGDKGEKKEKKKKKRVGQIGMMPNH
jgi:hypothetical protein